jgi:hypothetical protein
MALSDIIREVDEELRRENWEILWKKYGKFAIAAAVALVLGTAAVVGWREFDRSQRMAAGDAFGTMIAEVENTREPAQAADMLAAYIQDAPDGYATLARLREAKLRADAGEREAAVMLYDALAADSAVEPLFRDLASLYVVRMQVDGGDPATLNARLSPLAAVSNPWRYTARELQAVVALNSGDSATAREIFTRLADDMETPDSLRTRATEMLRAMGPS